MDKMVLLDIKELFTMVMVISVEVIGISEWLKRFSNCPADSKGCTLCKICSKRKINAVRSLVVLIICSVMNTTLIPSIISMLFDLIALGLAVTQLAYQTITNGVPGLVNSLFNKAAEFNIMKTDNSESGK